MWRVWALFLAGAAACFGGLAARAETHAAPIAADPARAQQLEALGPEAAAAVRAEDGGARLIYLGYQYDTGADGRKPDAAIAALFYGVACERAIRLGCQNLANLYREGRGVAQDDGEAFRLYRYSCNAGHTPGCTALGHMYYAGRGVAQNGAEAFRLYGRACEADEQYGCVNLGLMLQYGQGVTVDLIGAERAYRRALAIDPRYQRPAEQLRSLGLAP